MDSAINYHRLVAAVVVQAVLDCQNNQQREDALAFFASSDFIVLWDVLSERISGLPSAGSVRSRISSGQLTTVRRAYHRVDRLIDR